MNWEKTERKPRRRSAAIISNWIIIRWTDSTEAKSVTERGIDYLKAGDYEKGIATLRVAIQRVLERVDGE